MRARTDEEYAYFVERAEFCLRTGISPTEYDAMTVKELSAWVTAYNKLQKEKNKN